jgi:hypothetical protein
VQETIGFAFAHTFLAEMLVALFFRSVEICPFSLLSEKTKVNSHTFPFNLIVWIFMTRNYSYAWCNCVTIGLATQALLC